MNCPHCSAPNPEDATTCQECGRDLTAAQPAPSPPVAKTSDSAIASLICGVLGWSVLPIIGAILAIALGHHAKNEIRASSGTLNGEALAALGLALGYSSLVLAALGILLAIVLTALGIGIPLCLGMCGLCAAFGC